MKKRLAIIILALLLLSGFPLGAQGQESRFTDRKCSLTVWMKWGTQEFQDGSLTAFRVGDVNREGEFQLIPELASCEMDPDLLYGQVKHKQLSGTTVQIRQGKARFTDMEIGLYLVAQEEASTGYSIIYPFLIALPGVEGNWLLFDLEAYPKVSPETNPDETEPGETDPDETNPEGTTEPSRPGFPPPENPGKEPTLPQTGQLNWPVPVMAVAGTSLLLLGCWLCFGKRKPHES